MNKYGITDIIAVCFTACMLIIYATTINELNDYVVLYLTIFALGILFWWLPAIKLDDTGKTILDFPVMDSYGFGLVGKKTYAWCFLAWSSMAVLILVITFLSNFGWDAFPQTAGVVIITSRLAIMYAPFGIKALK